MFNSGSQLAKKQLIECDVFIKKNVFVNSKKSTNIHQKSKSDVLLLFPAKIIESLVKINEKTCNFSSYAHGIIH